MKNITKRIYFLNFFAVMQLLLFVSTAQSQQIMLYGVIDCGQWLKARKDGAAQYYEYNLLGLINGLQMGRKISIWNYNGTKITAEQFYFWMDNYCSKNPLSSTITGAGVFANEVTNSEFNK